MNLNLEVFPANNVEVCNFSLFPLLTMVTATTLPYSFQTGLSSVSNVFPANLNLRLILTFESKLSSIVIRRHRSLARQLRLQLYHVYQQETPYRASEGTERRVVYSLKNVASEVSTAYYIFLAQWGFFKFSFALLPRLLFKSSPQPQPQRQRQRQLVASHLAPPLRSHLCCSENTHNPSKLSHNERRSSNHG